MTDKGEFDKEKTWEFLLKGIREIHDFMELGKSKTKLFNAVGYTKLYTAIYDLCTEKSNNDPESKALYDKYVNCFEQYLTSTVFPCLRDKHDVYMLNEFVKRWTNHKIMMNWLSRFFRYLDRYYIQRKELTSLHKVGIDSFYNLIYKEVNGRILNIVLSQIDRERDGNQIDRGLIKNVIQIYVEIGDGDMGFYENDFESPMLEATSAYYSRKASNWILEYSCPDYMAMTEKCLNGEKDRVKHYLVSSTEKKLMEKVQHELLIVHCNQLLEKEQSGLLALLRNDMLEDLSRMFKLFSLIPDGLESVAKIFKKHLTEEGTNLVIQAEEDATNNKKQQGSEAPVAVAEKKKKDEVVGMGNLKVELVFVRKLIELHDKYLSYVTTKCFMNNAIFHIALKEGFEVFCNQRINGSLCAEILAIFCDTILKKSGGGSEKLSDDGIEETLDKVVKILAYVFDKDLFAEFCRKKLARRLLFHTSLDDDLERSLLTKLKQKCGGQFTSKMEGMITDLILARDHQVSFLDYIAANNHSLGGIDLNVTVLTTGFWPNYKSFDLTLPAELAKCVGLFREYHEKKSGKRKLTWIYSLGSCNVIGKFEQKTIELIVSVNQASALLLFNDSDKLSYEEIKSQIGLLHDEDVVRLLSPLSCEKYKILNKQPNNKIVSPGDVFEFNAKFTDKMRRIRIPVPMVAADEKKKVLEDVDHDRRYIIDASLVRIMKSRKILGYQELVMECIEQLERTMFKPEIKSIKGRIEELIARDYLERDKTNPNVFNYVA